MDNNKPKDGLESNILPSNALPSIGNTIRQLDNRYQIAATSDNTRLAYQADIRHYETWGGQLPATTEGSRYINKHPG